MVAASHVLAVLGWGACFPRAVPVILAGAGDVAVEPASPGGIALVILAAVVGMLATIIWWERADQTG
jgi:ABC-2 type transport system permease protein